MKPQPTYWKVTRTRLKIPVLRKKASLVRRSSNLIEEYLHPQYSLSRRNFSTSNFTDVSPTGRGMPQSQMQKKRYLWRRRETSSVDTLPGKEPIPHLTQESPIADNTPKFTPSSIKHRYFYLSDSSPIYDLKAKSIEKVENIQDVKELQTLAKSFEAGNTGIVKKISENLDYRINELRVDRKRMQSIHFDKKSAMQSAPDAFKALKAEDQMLVMELTEQTLLHWATKRKFQDLAIFLIEKGADPDKADIGGRTPRVLARMKGLNSLMNHINKVKPRMSGQLITSMMVKKTVKRVTQKSRTRKIAN